MEVLGWIAICALCFAVGTLVGMFLKSFLIGTEMDYAGTIYIYDEDGQTGMYARMEPGKVPEKNGYVIFEVQIVPKKESAEKTGHIME